jgi:HSP20 family protein
LAEIGVKSKIQNPKSKIEMAESINRYFQFIGSSKNFQPSGKLWYPSADIYQTPDGWIVKVELAGVCADDIEIEVEGKTLYIAGTRKDTICGRGIHYQQMEITYSRFEKNLDFPDVIENAKLEYNYDNGLLMIYLRKGGK